MFHDLSTQAHESEHFHFLGSIYNCKLSAFDDDGVIAPLIIIYQPRSLNFEKRIKSPFQRFLSRCCGCRAFLTTNSKRSLSTSRSPPLPPSLSFSSSPYLSFSLFSLSNRKGPCVCLIIPAHMGRGGRAERRRQGGEGCWLSWGVSTLSFRRIGRRGRGGYAGGGG